jgi:multidrug efflux system membrane fusion protein
MSEAEKLSETESEETPPPRDGMARTLVGALVGGGILAGSFLAAQFFWTHQEEAERKKPKRQVTVVQAIRLQPQSFVIKVPSQGRVRARAQSSIIPEISGRIISIEQVFREGGFFQPEQVLLTLDKTNPSNDIARAEATLAQLDAKLALQKLERSAYSNAVVVAQANLAQAGAALELEEARRSAAIANLKRLNTLDKSSPLARNEPQVAEAAAKAKAKEAELAKAKEDLALRPDQLEADLEAQIRAADVTLAQANIDLARTVVRAPKYPGRIIAKNADIGQYVTSGTVLAMAIATDYAEVHLPVSNARLQHIRVPLHRANTNETQATQIEIPIDPPAVEIRMQIGRNMHRWQGHISRDSGRHDATSQQLALIAHIDKPYGDTPYLRAGLFVQATITGDTLENVFVLPRHAVRHGNEVALAMQKDGQSTLKRQIIEILWSNEAVMITRSLKSGDVIITTPIDYATNGQSLQVRVDGEAAPPPFNGKPKSKKGKQGKNGKGKTKRP